MSHRPEHEAWMRQILLGESDPREGSGWTRELSDCESCRGRLAQMQKTQESLDLAAMERRFENAARAQVLPSSESDPSGSFPRPLRWLRPVLAVAAALLLGFASLFFLDRPSATDDSGGLLGGEIRIQRSSPEEFSWNAAGCDEFSISIRDAGGKEIRSLHRVSETIFRIGDDLRVLLEPGREYEILVVGKNPRPNAPNPSASLRFSYP